MSEELVIPIKKKELGHFISSLLGQPQNIEREIFGNFDLDHGWILNLIYLLNQRILHQNDSKLVEFKIQIGFSNDSKRNFYSLEEFELYNEVKKLQTEMVKINMVYLINFPGSSIPERQEIMIFLDTKSPISIGYGLPFESLFKKREGRISYNIFYTERSWGDDIDRIISNELDKVIKEKKKYKLILRMIFMLFSLIITYGIMLVPIFKQEQFVKLKKMELIKTLPQDAKLLTNDIKLDFLFKLNTMEVEHSGAMVVNFIMGVVLSIIVFVLAMLIIKRKSNTFIVLTEYDSKQRKKALDKKTLQMVLLIVSYILTIIFGVISNILYNNYFC